MGDDDYDDYDSILLANAVGESLVDIVSSRPRQTEVFDHQKHRDYQRESKEQADLFAMIQRAKRRGAKTIDQIHWNILARQEKVFGNPSDSWRVRAMIEYILRNQS